MKDFFKNNWLYILFSLVGIAIFLVVYRVFFEFNNTEVRAYIFDEASKYPAQQQEGVTKIISEGVDYILMHNNLTSQVKKSAKASNIPVEQELVHAAIMQCKSFGYLK